MGNSLYRISPRKIYNSSSGKSSNFEFAANQITGWRNSQEDRYVCLPNFVQDFSLFAVYDGHGGEEVVQYLERFLHKFISKELELTQDVELALYLSFLNCDSSLRSISQAEYALIKEDLVKEFEVPNKAERRRVLFGSFDGAGTSGENLARDELRAAIASTCIKELPSISYLTKAPVQDTDESDDDYEPGDKDINYLADERDSSDEMCPSDDSSESYSSESNDSSMVLDTEKTQENIASTSKEDGGSSTGADIVEKADINDSNLKTMEDNENAVYKKEEPKEKEDFGQQIGMHCGSTATVLLINETTIYIAHVGDSRCVACIKGKAVELSTDHRPTDKDELERIIDAGGTVSEDGRISGDIDMSRAFGDFRFKAVDNPFQILSVEPSISSIPISPDLDFIIIASDGIWNTMDTDDVIDYIQNRILDSSLELQDLCGELFEELLPEKITPDGSGCDNMTAILLRFSGYQKLSQKGIVCIKEVYEYSSAKFKSNKSPAEENLDKKIVQEKEEKSKLADTKKAKTEVEDSSSLSANCGEFASCLERISHQEQKINDDKPDLATSGKESFAHPKERRKLLLNSQLESQDIKPLPDQLMKNLYESSKKSSAPAIRMINRSSQTSPIEFRNDIALGQNEFDINKITEAFQSFQSKVNWLKDRVLREATRCNSSNEDVNRYGNFYPQGVGAFNARPLAHIEAPFPFPARAAAEARHESAAAENENNYKIQIVDLSKEEEVKLQSVHQREVEQVVEVGATQDSSIEVENSGKRMKMIPVVDLAKEEEAKELNFAQREVAEEEPQLIIAKDGVPKIAIKVLDPPPFFRLEDVPQVDKVDVPQVVKEDVPQVVKEDVPQVVKEEASEVDVQSSSMQMEIDIDPPASTPAQKKMAHVSLEEEQPISQGLPKEIIEEMKATR